MTITSLRGPLLKQAEAAHTCYAPTCQHYLLLSASIVRHRLDRGQRACRCGQRPGCSVDCAAMPARALQAMQRSELRGPLVGSPLPCASTTARQRQATREPSGFGAPLSGRCISPLRLSALLQQQQAAVKPLLITRGASAMRLHCRGVSGPPPPERSAQPAAPPQRAFRAALGWLRHAQHHRSQQGEHGPAYLDAMTRCRHGVFLLDAVFAACASSLLAFHPGLVHGTTMLMRQWAALSCCAPPVTMCHTKS